MSTPQCSATQSLASGAHRMKHEDSTDSEKALKSQWFAEISLHFSPYFFQAALPSDSSNIIHFSAFHVVPYVWLLCVNNPQDVVFVSPVFFVGGTAFIFPFCSKILQAESTAVGLLVKMGYGDLFTWAFLLFDTQKIRAWPNIWTRNHLGILATMDLDLMDEPKI